MLDDDKGDFVGTAVEEETGIKFKLEDMVDLTNYCLICLIIKIAYYICRFGNKKGLKIYIM
ncbi:hypothetical protein AHAS_Ahas01G0191000 [Arachis hypogaea]